ncbi:hypothetical protein ACQ4M3_05620 [Leptolyngbya sp. AN03gr2]|uniref:hypothetical protein n=1 Tax=unclassified Leptolyngbya TaxID=2650499 RepID=UPI003D31B7DF
MAICLRFGDITLSPDQVMNGLVCYQLLDSLLAQLWLDAEVLPQIALSEGEIFAALTGQDRSQQPDDFKSWLSEQMQRRHISQSVLEWRVIRPLRIQKLKHSYFDPQLESEFLRRKARFDRVEFSVIQTSNSQLAQELFFAIRDDGIEFSKIAQSWLSHSSDPCPWRVGPVPLVEVPNLVAEAFCSGSEGKVYGPFQIGTQFWVVKLERYYSAQLTNVVRSQLRDQLFQEWLTAQVQTKLAQPGQLQIGSIDSTISNF